MRADGIYIWSGLFPEPKRVEKAMVKVRCCNPVNHKGQIILKAGNSGLGYTQLNHDKVNEPSCAPSSLKAVLVSFNHARNMYVVLPSVPLAPTHPQCLAFI